MTRVACISFAAEEDEHFPAVNHPYIPRNLVKAILVHCGTAKARSRLASIIFFGQAPSRAPAGMQELEIFSLGSGRTEDFLLGSQGWGEMASIRWFNQHVLKRSSQSSYL
jgi:hypothetical protein